MIAGQVEARTRQEVIERLAEMGYCTLHLRPARRWPGVLRRAGGGPGPGERAFLYRQLVSMVRAGLTLPAALAALEVHARPRLRPVLTMLRRRLEQGAQLHEAMAALPRAFPALHAGLVRAGEVSGRLELALERLAALQEAEVTLRARVRSALTYPAIVVAAAGAVAVLVVTVVLPSFLGAFPELERTLPTPTRALLATGQAARSWWPAILAAALAGAWGLRSWGRTPRGRARRDRLLLRLPLAGHLLAAAVLARVLRTLATLVESGLPLPEALEACAGAAGNVVYARALRDARAGVTQGQPLVEPLEMGGVFPPLVVQAVRTGEQTGRLEEMLARAAEFYEREVEEGVKRMTAGLEPVLVLTVGGLVAFVAASVFFPLFRLIATVQAGL